MAKPDSSNVPNNSKAAFIAILGNQIQQFRTSSGTTHCAKTVFIQKDLPSAQHVFRRHECEEQCSYLITTRTRWNKKMQKRFLSTSKSASLNSSQPTTRPTTSHHHQEVRFLRSPINYIAAADPWLSQNHKAVEKDTKNSRTAHAAGFTLYCRFFVLKIVF